MHPGTEGLPYAPVVIAALPQELDEDVGWLPALPWALLLTIVGEAIAVMFLVRVVRRGGSIAVTLNWTFVILAAPYLGVLLYYLLPRGISRLRLRRRQKRLAWIEPTLSGAAAASEPARSLDPVNRLLRNFDPDAVQRGNALELLDTGPDALAAMRDAIERAEHFVHLQTYIFRPDAGGQEVMELLRRAAERGLEVRLLYDSFGSWSLKQRHVAPLRAAGARVAAFMPLLWRRRPFTLNLRNHRKLLVVDGRLAILGGRNVGSEYLTGHLDDSRLPWLDAMAAVRGPIAARLHRVFVEDWYHATAEDLSDVRYFPRSSKVGQDLVGVVDTGPDALTSVLPLVLQQLIGCARRRLDISSPYLVPSPVVQSALELAARRGVLVRIHTNGRPVEQWMLYRAQRSYYASLRAAGVRIFESRTAYNHAKLIVVDDRYACIGSPNLDWRSAELNFELAIVATRCAFVAHASELFARRVATATEVEESPPPRVLDGLCRLASPLL